MTLEKNFVTLYELTKPQFLEEFLETRDLNEKNIVVNKDRLYSFSELFFEGYSLTTDTYGKNSFVVVNALINILKKEYPVRLGYLLYHTFDDVFDNYLRSFDKIYNKISLDSIVYFFPTTLYKIKGTDLSPMFDKLKKLVETAKDLIKKEEILYMLMFFWNQKIKYPDENYSEVSDQMEILFRGCCSVYWEKVKDVNLVWNTPFWLMAKDRLDYFILHRSDRVIQFKKEPQTVTGKALKQLYEY